MLAKCANPSCFASFRHLAEGRLFRVETNSTVRSSTAKTTEYWLCKDCSAGMTLHFAQDGEVGVTRLKEALRNGPQGAFVSLLRLCLPLRSERPEKLEPRHFLTECYSQ